MTWPFESDTSAITRRLSNAHLRQNRFRNHLIGIIIFMAVWMVRRQKKQSLVEQMRALE